MSIRSKTTGIFYLNFVYFGLAIISQPLLQNLLEAVIKKNPNLSFMSAAYILPTSTFLIVCFLGLLTTKKSLKKSLLSLEIFVKVLNENNSSLTKAIHTKRKDEIGVIAGILNKLINEKKDLVSKHRDECIQFEKKILTRTKDLTESTDFIKAMMNSLEQGLLVFNSSGVCLRNHTKSAINIFQNPIHNSKIYDIIPQVNKETLKEWIDISFSEAIPFDSCKPLAPQGFQQSQYGKPDFKHILLDYFPIRDKKEKIKNIVISATDNTASYIANEKSKEKEEKVEMITMALSDINQYTSFISSAKNIIQDLKTVHINQTQEIMRYLHSLKGNAALYKFTSLTKALHSVETLFLKSDSLTEEIKQKEVASIENIFNASYEYLKETLGEQFFSQEKIHIHSHSTLFNFYKSIHDKSESKRFKEHFIFEDLKALIQPYEKMSQELAGKLQKEILPFDYDLKEIRVDSIKYQKVIEDLVHVFRNMIDHGVETPAQRQSKGKGNSGLIKVIAEINEQQISLIISDDGAGIDPAKIKEKLATLNYSPESLIESEEKIIDHIFDESFSTNEEVTEISGRGVGLNALRASCSEIGGNVSVTSTLNQGAEFRITLPI